MAEHRGKLRIIRSSAVFEMLVFFIPVVTLNIVFGDGQRFINLSPHPFWIIILLITVQYGTREGVMCAIVSSIVLLAGNIPKQGFNQDFYEYLLLILYRPIIWLTTAVILGQLRVRQIENRKEIQHNLDEALEREKVVTEAYSKLKDVKETLEVRLASQVKSTSAAYGALKAVDTLDQKSILAGVEDMIKVVMNPDKFSVYALDKNGFEPTALMGWSKNEPYQRYFDNQSPLYQAIIGRQRILCVINEEDAMILGDEGIMAAPLVDESSGEVFGMLKIEELNFTEITLSNVETFKVIAEIVGMAYANAAKFRAAQENSLINFDTELPSHKLFRRQCDLVLKLKQKSNLKASIIEAKLLNTTDFSREERYSLAMEFANVAKTIIPDGDFYSGRRSGMELLILLPNISSAEAKKHASSLHRTIKDIESGELARAKFSFGTNKIEGGSSSNRRRSDNNQ